MNIMLDIKELKPIEVLPGFRGRFVHTEAMTIAFWEVDAGATLPVHNHVNAQTTYVVEGEFEFTVEGQKTLYTKGKMAVLKPWKEHGGQAITDCKLIDTFTPARMDYKALEDQ